MKPILDACCGSKMFYFDKQNPLVLYQDIREPGDYSVYSKKVILNPDHVGDFRKMDFPVREMAEHMLECYRYKAEVALESLDALRWRNPVKEPPEEDAYILVYLMSRCAIIAHYDKNSGEWSDDTGSSICNHVKAWLPLPEWERA